MSNAIIMDAKTQLRFETDRIKSSVRITPTSRMIILTSEDYRRYQRETLEKAGVLLDKIIEYNKIPEILSRLASPFASQSTYLGPRYFKL